MFPGQLFKCLPNSLWSTAVALVFLICSYGLLTLLDFVLFLFALWPTMVNIISYEVKLGLPRLLSRSRQGLLSPTWVQIPEPTWWEERASAEGCPLTCTSAPQPTCHTPAQPREKCRQMVSKGKLSSGTKKVVLLLYLYLIAFILKNMHLLNNKF